MRHEMSLCGPLFDDAVKMFDAKLRAVMETLKKQGLSEGSVALKVGVELYDIGEYDEDGNRHQIDKVYFNYNCTSAITQKSKSDGTVAEPLKLREVNGQLELRDLGENTLFDIVEGGVQDGAQPDRDGTPG